MAVYEYTSSLGFLFKILIDLKNETIQCHNSPIPTSNDREIDSWYIDDEFNVKCLLNGYFYHIVDNMHSNIKDLESYSPLSILDDYNLIISPFEVRLS